MARDYESVVKALLAKATSLPEDNPERKALEERAFLLMSRYGVKLALEEQDTDKTATHFKVSFTGQWVSRQGSLFNTISKHFGCTLIDATNTKENTYYIFGFESDVDSTLFLYTILENQMLAELARVKVPAGNNTKSYRNAWLWGYITRIRERLESAKKTVEQEQEPGTGIVLRDRSLAVQDAVHEKFPRTKRVTHRYRGAEAFNQGAEAGSKARFSLKDAVSGNRRELG